MGILFRVGFLLAIVSVLFGLTNIVDGGWDLIWHVDAPIVAIGALAMLIAGRRGWAEYVSEMQ